MTFSIPEVDQLGWGQPLKNHLAQLNDPETGGLNKWKTRPILGVDNQPLGLNHKGLTGYNESTFMFETWDGEKWNNLNYSTDISIETSNAIELDFTQSYIFSISSSTIPAGWSWDSIITSNIPFNLPVHTSAVFYTSNKDRYFSISNTGTGSGWLLSGNKITATSLTDLHGQSFTVYKQIPAPSSPKLSYFSSDTEQSSNFVSILNSTVNSVSSFSSTIQLISNYLTLNFVVDANSYSLLQQLVATHTTVGLRLSFPLENRCYHVKINQASFSLGNNKITAAATPYVPVGSANFELTKFNAHWVPPTTQGTIEYSLTDKRTFSQWTPFSINQVYRRPATSPTFPAALNIALTASGENLYPINLGLSAAEGWAWGGLSTYNGYSTSGGNSGLAFWCRTYVNDYYPNQLGWNYLPIARMFLHTNGHLGIGDNLRNPASKLHVDGNIQASGTITANSTASDIRLKENILPLPLVWSTLRQIQPFSFTWKKDFVIKEATPEIIFEDGSVKAAESEVISDFLPDGIFASFSAQEIEEKIYPEAVVEDGYGIKHLRMEALIPFLHASLIEVEDSLTAKLDLIIKDITAIKTRLTALEKKVGN